MFPPHDLRLHALPHVDAPLTHAEFWAWAEATFQAHSYFAVKRAKDATAEIGARLPAGGETRRWFSGWLADADVMESTLSRLRLLWLRVAAQQSLAVRAAPQAEFALLEPSGGGEMPRAWSVYNPSVAQLDGAGWAALCAGLMGKDDAQDDAACTEALVDAGSTQDGEPRPRSLFARPPSWPSPLVDNEDTTVPSHVPRMPTVPTGLAISWFGRAPGTHLGCATYLGIARPDAINELLGNGDGGGPPSTLWVLPPRLLHNVLGPKLADPRLYTYTHTASLGATDARGGGAASTQLALVGYARLGPPIAASALGMAEYYVRTSRPAPT